ncbi:ParB N-terminal domain-containing protein [Geminisphaera colitermitum]|uniref:ParB N-terminal domain-containing protein n=1 Tax=Geminisphaera colitermitum TaxID=1148786 RepID=UPI000158CA86|nr:ParB N-terminal domain-containing protein [Geminisphaera colitermitum]
MSDTTEKQFTFLPAELTEHPILAHIPMWANTEPEFQALAASVRERGFDYPALITSERRIVDGRNRRNVAAFLGISLPCRIVSADEVAAIAFSSIAHRRNLTKSALAYLVFPLVKPAFDEARQRALSNLKTGSESPSPTKLETGKTIETLTDEIGINREYMRMASDIHAAFKKHPKLREQFEAALISGQSSLTAIRHAIDGKIAANEGKTTPDKNDAPSLIVRAFTDLRNRWSRWEKIPEPKRQEVTAKVVTATAEWPREIVIATAAAWKKNGII